MRSNLSNTVQDKILHLPFILIVIGLSLAALLQGCGDCPPCPDGTTQPGRTRTTSVWPEAAPDDPEVHAFFLQKYVLKDDLFAARCYFRQKVHAGPTGAALQKLDSAAVVINWSNLSARMNDHFSSMPPPPMYKRAIRVIYGLSVKTSPVSYSFKPLIQFLEITTDTLPHTREIVDESSAIYGIDSTGELYLASKKECHEAIKNYFDLVHIYRNGAAAFTKADTATDVRHFSFHWESQLVPLVAHNSTPKYIKLTSIAEERPAGDPYAGVRHHLVAVALDNANKELISNDPVVTGIEYKNHGSDIGSACPPQCSSKLYFPSTGLSTPVCP